ncbi:MAG: hypothetical protein RLZZ211_2096 [Bacteroidota bacterium]|jgi:hypothetical protein
MKNIFLILFLLLQTFDLNAQTKIRLGDGTYSSNKVLYTIDGVKVREGDGTYSSNKVLYTIDGSLSITKIACLIYFIL